MKKTFGMKHNINKKAGKQKDNTIMKNAPNPSVASHSLFSPTSTMSGVPRGPIQGIKVITNAQVHTPTSRNGPVHKKRLADTFSKLRKTHVASNLKTTTVAPEIVVEKENIFPGTSTQVLETNARRIEPILFKPVKNVVEKQIPSSVSSLDSQVHPQQTKQLHQQTLELYLYPIKDTKKWIKEAEAKSRPPRQRVAKRLRTPATDELTEVLFWQGPPSKRTVRDVTDLEVALTVFKSDMEEYRQNEDDRNMLKIIKKYEELFEKGIVSKLKKFEEDYSMMQEFNMLMKENKKLSQKLGSLVDRRIKLQFEKGQ